jgi:hypothetical protein
MSECPVSNCDSVKDKVSIKQFMVISGIVTVCISAVIAFYSITLQDKAMAFMKGTEQLTRNTTDFAKLEVKIDTFSKVEIKVDNIEKSLFDLKRNQLTKEELISAGKEGLRK